MASFTDIHIKIIPAGCMRPGWTHGDYWVDENGHLQIRVSEFADPNNAFRIAMHELAEAWRYAAQHGADFSAIDQFDLAHQESDEPGRLPDAPYHDEHMLSEDIERLLVAQDGDDWNEYYNAEPIGVPTCPI